MSRTAIAFFGFCLATAIALGFALRRVQDASLSAAQARNEDAPVERKEVEIKLDEDGYAILAEDSEDEAVGVAAGGAEAGDAPGLPPAAEPKLPDPAIDDPEEPAPRFDADRARDAAPAGRIGSATSVREGTQVAKLVGSVRRKGTRYEFVPEDGRRPMTLLENQILERIAAHESRFSGRAATRWNVDGLVTEYRAENFLLASRAVALGD